MGVQTWHVVSDENGTILAVYGENLLAEAQEKARSIEASLGLPVYVHSIVAGRSPHVGGSISMRGIEFCDECGQGPKGSQSRGHAESCSLHPDNEVSRD